MGLLKKAQTTQRIRPDVIPLPAWTEWSYQARDALTAELVEAACHAARGGTESSMLRGRQNRLAATFRALTPSRCTLQESADGWALTFGPKALDPTLTDWVVNVSRLDPEAPGAPVRIAVDTIEALTLDGGLANGSRHDELRRRLRELASGAQRPSDSGTTGQAEAQATQGGLLQIPDTLSGSESLRREKEIVARTTLPVTQVRELLNTVPLWVMGESAAPAQEGLPGELWVFATSLLDPNQPSQASATLRDLGDRREVRITTHLGPSPTDPVIARSMNSSFTVAAAMVSSVIESVDPETEIEQRWL